MPFPVVVGLGILVGAAAVALGSFAFTYFALHPPRSRVRRTPAQYGIPYEDIAFLSTDGLKLSGWLIPPPAENDKRAVVIVCHGYPCNRVEMLPHAKSLHDAGFTTLLFDFRAMGESEGSLCTVGLDEIHDLRGALDYLASRPDTAALPVGALGHSLGAVVAIRAAARDERLRAIAAEAAFPHLQDALEARFRFFAGPFARLIARPIRYWAQRYIPADPHSVAPLEDIARLNARPILIIQGKRDLLVRWQDAVRLYERAEEPRELWLLERSGHARCFLDEPEEYARRTTAFFTQYLIRG